MGREVKRVSLNFNWPQDKVWEGYLNPLNTSVQCEACEGRQFNELGCRYEKEWYGYTFFDPIAYGSELLTYRHPAVIEFAEINVKRHPDYYLNVTGQKTSEKDAIMIEARRLANLWDNQWAHHLIKEDIEAICNYKYGDFEGLNDGYRFDIPIHDQIERQARLWWEHKGKPEGKDLEFWLQAETDVLKAKEAKENNKWGRLRFNNGYIPTIEEAKRYRIHSHGGSCHIVPCISQRYRRETGLDEEPTCTVCNGKGSIWPSEEDEKRYDEWERTEPPAGDGYQIWETVSEGSPISPVFSDPKELAKWMARYGSKGVTSGMTADQWLTFIDAGWAPSGVLVNGTFMSGAEAVATGVLKSNVDEDEDEED